ncbi:threonine-phosphate decarboxylase CobD [Vreelandella venusta]
MSRQTNVHEATDWPSHGGQAAALLKRFGLPADHVVDDVSANLNPFGPPEWLAGWFGTRLGVLSRYPSPDYVAARQAIAAHNDVQPAQVLLTNGGAEAIFLAAALHASGRALLLAPSFGEYARACSAHRIEMTEHVLREPHFACQMDDLLESAANADVVFLCRPNNPTGTLIAIEAVEALLAHTQATGTQVVVDEAFIDLSIGVEALTPLLKRYCHLVLLRSMTKFYTLPGLRLGYVLAAENLVDTMSRHQPPWSVNHFAAELVAPLLADGEFAQLTRQWLASEQPRLGKALQALGLEVVPSHSCFFLVRPSVLQRERGVTSADLFERMLYKGLLARHTHSFKGLEGSWLRLALRDEATNNRLLKVLHDCLC